MPRQRRTEELPPLSPELSELRVKLLRDYKAFYKMVIARDQIEPGLDRRRADCWGKIHDLAVDFSLMGVPNVEHYSDLFSVATRAGFFDGKEIWLYYRTLHTPPEIQEGPKGPISELFYEKPWQGVIIRLKGDLSKRCTLMPRGHLKSTLLSKGLALWFMLREPGASNLLRCVAMPLAGAFLQDIRFQFELNDRFSSLFADLIPTEFGEGIWSNAGLQLKSSARLGPDPSLLPAGMETDVTGKHPNYIFRDDIIAESNSKDAIEVAKAKITARNMFSLMNAGSQDRDYGTVWANNDPHTLYTDEDEDASFLAVTLIDGDTEGACKTEGIAGPGNPIWPEGFSPARVAKIRHDFRADEFQYRSQYFYHLHGTMKRLFERSWVKTRYIAMPSEIAAKQRLNICVGLWIDGGNMADGTPAGAIVLGQSRDNLKFMLLDAMKAVLDPRELVREIVTLCTRWKTLAEAWRGAFYVGMEKSAYVDYCEPLLDREQRRRGADFAFPVEALAHSHKSVRDGIAVLQPLYRDGLMEWPVAVLRPARDGASLIDMADELLKEFTQYPGEVHHPLLKAHALAYELSQLPDFKMNADEIMARDHAENTARSAQKRDAVFAQETFGPSLGNFGGRV